MVTVYLWGWGAFCCCCCCSSCCDTKASFRRVRLLYMVSTRWLVVVVVVSVSVAVTISEADASLVEEEEDDFGDMRKSHWYRYGVTMVRRCGSLRNWTCGGGIQTREEKAHAVVIVVEEEDVTTTTMMTIHQTFRGTTIVTTMDHQIEYSGCCCDTTITTATATATATATGAVRSSTTTNWTSSTHLERNVEG